jgi:hypothetical protein
VARNVLELVHPKKEDPMRFMFIVLMFALAMAAPGCKCGSDPDPSPVIDKELLDEEVEEVADDYRADPDEEPRRVEEAEEEIPVKRGAEEGLQKADEEDEEDEEEDEEDEEEDNENE